MTVAEKLRKEMEEHEKERKRIEEEKKLEELKRKKEERINYIIKRKMFWAGHRWFLHMQHRYCDEGKYTIYQWELDKERHDFAIEFFNGEFLDNIKKEKENIKEHPDKHDDIDSMLTEEDWNSITLERCLPLIEQEMKEQNLMTYARIIPDDQPEESRQKSYEKQLVRYNKYKRKAPTVSEGLVVLLFIMALTSILYDRVYLWIIEVVAFMVWREKEIKKFHPKDYENPIDDPLFWRIGDGDDMKWKK